MCSCYPSRKACLVQVGRHMKNRHLADRAQPNLETEYDSKALEAQTCPVAH